MAFWPRMPTTAHVHMPCRWFCAHSLTTNQTPPCCCNHHSGLERACCGAEPPRGQHDAGADVGPPHHALHQVVSGCGVWDRSVVQKREAGVVQGVCDHRRAGCCCAWPRACRAADPQLVLLLPKRPASTFQTRLPPHPPVQLHAAAGCAGAAPRGQAAGLGVRLSVWLTDGVRGGAAACCTLCCGLLHPLLSLGLHPLRPCSTFCCGCCTLHSGPLPPVATRASLLPGSF